MPLVKAQCTNCGGMLEVDSTKDAAMCPFCNTPYVVEKAINLFNVNNSNISVQNATINMNSILDADTMFENWIINGNDQYIKDYEYYYATDMNRIMFMKRYKAALMTSEPQLIGSAIDSINSSLFDGRFSKYRQTLIRRLREKAELKIAQSNQIAQAQMQQQQTSENRSVTIICITAGIVIALWIFLEIYLRMGI